MNKDYGCESSEQLNELFAAFAKAQGKFAKVKKTKTNEYFKNMHEGIDDIIDVIRLPLEENGLAVFQDVYTSVEGKEVLKTLISHSSGQWRSTAMILRPAKGDSHSFASCVTYMKRTMLKAVLGLAVADGADDDDGNKASGRDVEKKRLIAIRLGDLISARSNPEVLTKQILEKYNKESLMQMTEDQLLYVIDYLTAQNAQQIQKINNDKETH